LQGPFAVKYKHTTRFTSVHQRKSRAVWNVIVLGHLMAARFNIHKPNHHPPPPQPHSNQYVILGSS
jgi:hypothetical protein